jgi:hypothetical protein
MTVVNQQKEISINHGRKSKIQNRTTQNRTNPSADLLTTQNRSQSTTFSIKSLKMALTSNYS